MWASKGQGGPTHGSLLYPEGTLALLALLRTTRSVMAWDTSLIFLNWTKRDLLAPGNTSLPARHSGVREEHTLSTNTSRIHHWVTLTRANVAVMITPGSKHDDWLRMRPPDVMCWYSVTYSTHSDKICMCASTYVTHRNNPFHATGHTGSLHCSTAIRT